MLEMSPEFINGTIAIFEKISLNTEGQDLTHTEVRSYARCFLIAFRFEGVDSRVLALLSVLSAKHIAHYDRAFLAREIARIFQEKLNTIDRLDRQLSATADLAEPADPNIPF